MCNTKERNRNITNNTRNKTEDEKTKIKKDKQLKITSTVKYEV